MEVATLLPLAVTLIMSPLLLGVINRTKAMVGGRKGPPLLQPYYDLIKLLGKGAVYSRTTTWVFRAGPIVSLAGCVLAATLVPLGGCESLIKFHGDLILLAYLLGLGRLCTVLAALDTGSPFEGMGASREAMFSALAESAFLLGLAALARNTGATSLTQMHAALADGAWSVSGLTLALVTVALLVVFLAENSRIPVDDPNTHLELTMIHEVMVLDHGGPDFAFILYGASIKLWVLGALIINLVLAPSAGESVADLGVALAGMLILAVLVGLIESTMARLRMPRVPQLLVGATALSGLALVLEFGGIGK
ncbi:MAG: NADH-quinone oxidoreductase subunit H [Planctomycetia bacterium]|nr:NADH-quinone oxidoreductase subunit H [Planctomycetia bacterium]